MEIRANCSKCGAPMVLADRETLLCVNCGFYVRIFDPEDDVYYDNAIDIEAYTGSCDDFPEDFPPIDYDDVYNSED